MVLRPASLLQHPFPDIWRTVQDRDACRLTLVEKTNTFDIHQIEFLQIQRDVWSATLDLRFQLIKVLRSKLPAQTNARLVLTSDSLDLQRHGPRSEEQLNQCNKRATRKSIQDRKLEVRGVLKFQEFLIDEDNTNGWTGRSSGSVNLWGFESKFVNFQALDFRFEGPCRQP